MALLEEALVARRCEESAHRLGIGLGLQARGEHHHVTGTRRTKPAKGVLHAQNQPPFFLRGHGPVRDLGTRPRMKCTPSERSLS